MKKILFAALIALTVGVPAVSAGTERPLTLELPLPPRSHHPAISIQGREVVYTFSPYIDAASSLTFRASLRGHIHSFNAVIGDATVLFWDRADKEKKEQKGSTEDIVKFYKFFTNSLALPPITIDATDMTEDVDAGPIKHPQPVLWKATDKIVSENGTEYLLRCADSTVTINATEFLFPPQLGIDFRLGQKLGKLVALVRKDNDWFILATDYVRRHEPPRQ